MEQGWQSNEHKQRVSIMKQRSSWLRISNLYPRIESIWLNIVDTAQIEDTPYDFLKIDAFATTTPKKAGTPTKPSTPPKKAPVSLPNPQPTATPLSVLLGAPNTGSLNTPKKNVVS